MQLETNPPLSGVVFDIGVSGIVSHLRNGGLQSLAIKFLKPHKKIQRHATVKLIRTCWWGEKEKRKRTRVSPVYVLYFTYQRYRSN